MSRGLKAAVFVLFLAAATTARAGPDDLFDVGALRPGEQETLLALEYGRYALHDGHVLDTRPADPARALLTNARVAELLARGGARTENPNDEPGAVRASASYPSVVPKGAPGALEFDGGIARGGGIRGPPEDGASGAATPASDPAVLQARLVQRLVFKGSAKEKEAIAEAVGMILKTKTGRELAAQFINERATAEITMSDVKGSTTVIDGGRKILSGGPGFTEVHKDPPVISLNRVYLDVDADYRLLAMSGTLAHELFGHAFETQRAKKAGQDPAVNYFYRGDEVGSELIDWLVQTELANKVVDGSPGAYLENPEKYYRSLWTLEAYYVMTLSLEEMRNPVDSLKKRRKFIDAAEAKVKTDLADNAEWRPIIVHFKSKHGIAPALFAPAEEELRAFQLYAEGHRGKLVEIRATLEERIKHWSSPEGKAQKRAVIAAADSVYLKKLETRLEERARALKRLRAQSDGGRSPSSIITLPDIVIEKPASGPARIGLDELGRMYQEDKKAHPKHWSVK